MMGNRRKYVYLIIVLLTELSSALCKADIEVLNYSVAHTIIIFTMQSSFGLNFFYYGEP
jgi:hypothetical protein